MAHFSAAFLASAFLIVSSSVAPLGAQTVAPHAPLRILIVSDEVNPHGLPPADLTQPGEISTAILALSGLQLAGPDPVLEKIGRAHV